MEYKTKKVHEHKATININVYNGSTGVIWNPADYLIDIDYKHGQIMFWRRKVPEKIFPKRKTTRSK